MGCTYCGGRVGTHNEAIGHHDECRREFNRRRDAGLCVACGGGHEIVSRLECAACLKAGGAFDVYYNYPGGS